MPIPPISLADALLERSGLGKGYPRPLRVISSWHRRSVSARESDSAWISVKGIGWVHGPPWVYVSPKDDELCFGLLDLEAATREMAVSNKLVKMGIPAARCIACVRLTESELALLGVSKDITFQNNRPIQPAALFTRSKSGLRVCDHVPALETEWRDQLAVHFETTHAESIVTAFAKRLTASIALYQRLGAVNDTLAPDNVTVAGEVTDFEWFYVPGVPLGDGTTDVMFEARQRKEAFYFIDVMLSLCAGLQVDKTIAELADLGLSEESALDHRCCGFIEQLAQFASC